MVAPNNGLPEPATLLPSQIVQNHLVELYFSTGDKSFEVAANEIAEIRGNVEISNTCNFIDEMRDERTPADILFSLFIWADTPSGGDFWDEIFHKI